MTRAQRRHHRARVIARRLSIVKYAWRLFYTGPWWAKTGRLGKYNLACGCWACVDPKYRETRAREKEAY